MAKNLGVTVLLDFYGEMLTEKQRSFLDYYYNDDLSLSEIAENEGITRQGVHDMVKRCSKQLRGYEEKLHLVEKFLSIKEDVAQIHQLAQQMKESSDEEILLEIETISNQILEEL